MQYRVIDAPSVGGLSLLVNQALADRWSAEMDSLFGSMKDEAVARRVGKSRRPWRVKLNIKAVG